MVLPTLTFIIMRFTKRRTNFHSEMWAATEYLPGGYPGSIPPSGSLQDSLMDTARRKSGPKGAGKSDPSTSMRRK